MPAPTFAERYCAQHGLSRQRYHAHVFPRVLYPHARLLLVPVRTVSRLHFLADHEFVEDVGHVTCVADFTYPLGCYLEHPSNRGVLRRVFRLRVSARRMLRLLRETFAQTGAGPDLGRGTFQPFPDADSGDRAQGSGTRFEELLPARS
jgi:hypothetical protein